MGLSKFNLAIVLTYTGAIYSSAAFALPTPSQSVAEVVSHLEGVMDTSAQAAANSDKANVRMTTCRVEVADANNSSSVYLYQEQALNESLDAPYRQRFLEIYPGKRQDIVVSRSYKPESTEVWNGFCDRPQAQRIVDSDRLGQPLCSVFLKKLVSVYEGKTKPGGCPTNFRGANYITNTIILHDRGMDTWDRGFDKAGDRVWGADETGYQYRWSNKEK
ncbi:chromophore lyase CpcT/CpeT [Myxosarcina sp. GI1]|uniref:chromophore lyase CpcT/CpeT n=1 Tax=Myxosarcina sp. GI1 TaxID=1541065 RepID=UPI000691854F|nr:chromophore lyase CpcT/CpeT [Myxosarcina sp. GI1]